MKISPKKLEELRLLGYTVDSLNEPPAEVPKPRKKRRKPKVTAQESPAAPAVNQDTKTKKWRFDVVRDTSGFIVSIDATELK